MEQQLEEIKNYIETLHNKEDSVIENVTVKPKFNDDKMTLDMKILQNRIDSVCIVQYYRDLKNERIKATNAVYIDDESAFKDKMDDIMESKPWTKLDKFIKKKKITYFVNKLVETLVITQEMKEEVLNKLINMLELKQITKKNIDFDSSNQIIRLDEYKLVTENI
jgi:hypothetical protein